MTLLRGAGPVQYSEKAQGTCATTLHDWGLRLMLNKKLLPHEAFSLLLPFLHILKNSHQKPLEKLRNGTRRDLLGHWTQPPTIPSNPPIPVRILSDSTLMNILYYPNWNENFTLSRASPRSLSHLGAASCKQLQNRFSAQLQNPSCDACKNLDNVLPTCVLRLLSIMFINIVSFLLILSRQPVPSVASCDMCRLSSSQ